MRRLLRSRIRVGARSSGLLMILISTNRVKRGKSYTHSNSTGRRDCRVLVILDGANSRVAWRRSALLPLKPDAAGFKLSAGESMRRTVASRSNRAASRVSLRDLARAFFLARWVLAFAWTGASGASFPSFDATRLAGTVGEMEVGSDGLSMDLGQKIMHK
jgi:hypothetical protein